MQGSVSEMKRLLFLTLVLLALVSCSSPTPEVQEPQTTPTVEALDPTPSPTATATQVADIPANIAQMHPADVDNSTLPITPVEELNLTGRPQEYDVDTYRLVVDGLVENPLSLTYDEVLSFPQVTETVLLICPGFFWDNAEWTGTPLSLILEQAGVSPEASMVRVKDGGGYTQTFTVEDASADGVFLAYEVNGETVPPEHGYPLRLVVRHQYGSKWVKWVQHIEIL
jgi:DMSO/TMAO reductase YedYZ molybdopterin-dependent catalytic subunit